MENGILDVFKGIRNSLESFQRTGLYFPAKHFFRLLIAFTYDHVMETWAEESGSKYLR